MITKEQVKDEVWTAWNNRDDLVLDLMDEDGTEARVTLHSDGEITEEYEGLETSLYYLDDVEFDDNFVIFIQEKFYGRIEFKIAYSEVFDLWYE